MALEDRVHTVGLEALTQISLEIQAACPDLLIEVEFISQRPADALIAVAQARGAETIAVDRGGKGPLRAALLGNVTYEIVRRSTVPMLVVSNDETDSLPGA